MCVSRAAIPREMEISNDSYQYIHEVWTAKSYATACCWLEKEKEKKEKEREPNPRNIAKGGRPTL